MAPTMGFGFEGEVVIQGQARQGDVAICALFKAENLDMPI